MSPTRKGAVLKTDRYVSPPAKGPLFVEIPVVQIGVPLVEEVISGPGPSFIPWVITGPTSYGYYAW